MEKNTYIKPEMPNYRNTKAHIDFLEKKRPLRMLVRSFYETQFNRILKGNQLLNTIYAKMGINPKEKLDKELKKKRQEMIFKNIIEYAELSQDESVKKTRKTDIIVDQKYNFYEKIGATNPGNITEDIERLWSVAYLEYLRNEDILTKEIERRLNEFPIYTDYLKKIPGVGPAMSGVIIGYFDVFIADYASCFHKYAGVCPGPDGAGLSRKKEHMVRRKYIDKNGKEKEKDSVAYNPFVKTKLLGVLATSFLRVYGKAKKKNPNIDKDFQYYANDYYAEVARINADPEKMEDVNNDKQIQYRANRKMIRNFLTHLWLKWRSMENLMVTPPYNERVLGMVHNNMTDAQRLRIKYTDPRPNYKDLPQPLPQSPPVKPGRGRHPTA